MAGKWRNRARNKKKAASVSSARQAGPIAPLKPLSYLSVKCVLEYLEPNKRFEVSRRIPSLRPTERVVPLKIKELKLDENSVTINRVTYSLGIIRKFKDRDQDDYDESNIRGWVVRENRAGGVPYDIDEYGNRDVSFDEVLEPGDISLLEEPRVKMTRQSGELAMEHLTETFRNCVITFSRRAQQAWEGTRKEMVWVDMYFIKRFLENRPRPFKNFLQLSIREEGGDEEDEEVKKLWRVPYDTMKLYKAYKVLTTTFFHHDTIQVDHLTILSSQIVLRLPRDLKFQTRVVNLDQDAGRILDLLKPIITEFSFPLDSLEVYSMHNLSIRNDFKTLVICGDYRDHGEDYDNYAKVTHVANGRGVFFRRLLCHWLRNHKNIGTCLTAGFGLEIEAEYVLKELRAVRAEDEFQFVIREERRLTLHLDNHTMIRITVETNPDPYPEEEWIVKFEVMPMEFN